ncbi:MAG: hypothetical protein RPU14_03830 [Candidatus Sedimenticola sp. (ex Thyasira tokunagai)]
MRIFNSKSAKAKKRYQTLVEAMSKKHDLESRRAELKSEVGELDIQCRPIEIKIRDARHVVSANEDSENQSSLELADEYKEKEAELVGEQKKLHKAIKLATGEIEAIDKSLMVLNQGATADEVAIHQTAVLDTADKVAQLNELITEQQVIIDGANEGLIDLSPLLQKKEDILSDIAQGTAAREDLQPIEAEINKLEAQRSDQRAKKDKAATEARQVVSGLKRKLEALEAELAHLNQLTPKIMDQFLMKEAEAVCSEYQKQAMQAILSLTRLSALEHLLAEQGQRPAPIFLTGNQSQTFLPDSVINPISNSENRGILFSGLYPNSDLVLKAIRTERERFEAMGLIAP